MHTLYAWLYLGTADPCLIILCTSMWDDLQESEEVSLSSRDVVNWNRVLDWNVWPPHGSQTELPSVVDRMLKGISTRRSH
jgi:hypothetical protein